MFRSVTAQLSTVGNLLHIGPLYQQTEDQRELRGAIERGDRASVKRLLANRPNLALLADANGATPLHWLMAAPAQRHRAPAIGRDNGLVMLNCLLDARADPNHRDRTGRTPLHVAAQGDGDPSWLRVLLARGADVHAVDADGRTALHLALAAGAREAGLIALLEAGADPLRWDRNGQTPASLARGRHWQDARLNALAGLHREPSPRGARPGGPAVAGRGSVARSASYGGTSVASTSAAGAGVPAVLSGTGTLRDALVALGDRCLQGKRLAPADLTSALRGMAARLRDFDPARSAAAERHGDIALALRILLAVCPDVDGESLQACHECLRGIRQAQPDMEQAHRATVIPLYIELSRLWARTGQWKEAYCYAFQAYRLDEAAGGAHQRNIEDTIDRLERGMERQDVAHWGPIATVPMRAAWFDIGIRLSSDVDLVPTLREAHRLLQQAVRARQWLHGDLEPASAIPVMLMLGAVEHVLDGSRATASRAAEFVEVAQLVLAMARDMQGVGLAADGAALCDMVVRYHEEEECVGELREFDCEPHRQLARTLRQSCDMLPQPRTWWRQFREALRVMRDEARQACATLALPVAGDAALADWREPLPIERTQQAMGARCSELVRRMAELCEARMLCEPPCRYALMALGSVGRGDSLPFSDVEFVLVVEQPVDQGGMVERWFSRFTRLLELTFHGVGESSAGADHALPVPRGFELDSSVGAASAWSAWLGTPGQFAQRLRQRADLNRHDRLHTDQDLCFSLLSTTLLHGNAELADTLWRSLAAAIDDPPDDAIRYSGRQDIALHQMHADLQRLRARWQRADGQDAPIELKADYAGPLTYLLTGLAQCYGFRDASVARMLCRLHDAGRFSVAFLKDWRWAVATVQTIRCRVQLASAARVDTVGPDRLHPDERAALHAVDARVLRPLVDALSEWLERSGFPSHAESGPAAIAHLRALDGCDPGLLPFERPATRARRTPTDPVALRGLVATLAVRAADLPTLRHYYRRVLVATPSGQLATCWSIWRDYLETSAYGRAALAVLARIPNASGWRGDWTEARAAFRAGLQAWAGPPTSGHMMLQLPDHDGDGRPTGVVSGLAPVPLSAVIGAQLFDANGSPRQAAPDAGFGVDEVPVTVPGPDGPRAYRVRFHPANAGAELAHHALECRIAGAGGMPFGMPARVFAGNRWHAVLITEAIDGPTLAQRLADAPETLDAIDAASFARALLRALLANPYDDGADRYVLEPDAAGALVLRRTGPERSFPAGSHWPPADDGAAASVLYALDPMMAPLEQDAVAALCSLHPRALVRAWMADVARIQRLHRSLFSAEDIEAAFSAGESPMLLTAVAEPAAAEQLLMRLTMIRGLARLARTCGVVLTGMDLLRAVRPDLAGHYLEAFMRYPVGSGDGAAAVAERVAWARHSAGAEAPLTGDKTMRAAAIPVAAAPRHRAVSLADVRTAAQAGEVRAGSDRVGGRNASGEPVQDGARMRYRERGNAEDLERLTLAVLQGESGANTRFAALPPLQRTAAVNFCADVVLAGALQLTVQEGRRLLAVLAGTPLEGLDLRAFSPAVDDGMLGALLEGAGENLRALDVSGCTGLTPGSMALIEKHATRLTRLAMRDMPFTDLAPPTLPVPVLPMGPLIASQPAAWVLPHLGHLDLEGSGLLQRIRLNTPALTTLDLAGCASLREVVIGARRLRNVNLTGCASLDEPALIDMIGNGADMETARLDGCTPLRHGPWLERFPWLLDFSWNPWTAPQIAVLDTLLQQASGHGRRAFTPRARFLVREAITVRERAIEALRRLSARANVPAELRAQAAAAADVGITIRTDPRIADAVDAFSPSGDSGSMLIVTLVNSLQSANTVREVRYVLETVRRVMEFPSPEQIAHWMER